MAEPGPRIQIQLEPDARLLAGVVAAVGFVAKFCGLDQKAGHDMRTAVESAVRDTFDLLTESGKLLEIHMEGYGDRFEVVLEHRGEALPTAGLDTFLNAGAQDASAGAVTGLALLSLVDRVLYNTENGLSRTTLVKYRNRKRG